MQLCLCDGWSNEGGDRTKCPAHGHLYVMLEALERRADDLLVCLKDAEKDLETEHRVREHFGKMIEEIMDAFGKPCKVEQADLPRHVHRLLRACRSLHRAWREEYGKRMSALDALEREMQNATVNGMRAREEQEAHEHTKTFLSGYIDASESERNSLCAVSDENVELRAERDAARAEVTRLKHEAFCCDCHAKALKQAERIETFIELIALGADREALSQCDCQSERDGVWVRWALKQSDEAAKLLDRNDSCEDDDCYDPGDPLPEVEKEKS
jgi:nicotinamide mononucleotide adenylyltransferase